MREQAPNPLYFLAGGPGSIVKTDRVMNSINYQEPLIQTFASQSSHDFKYTMGSKSLKRLEVEFWKY